MQTKTVSIPAISCGHCVHTVQNEVSDIAGVVSVVASEADQNATIQWDAPATWEQIRDLLIEIEYPAAE